MRRELEKIFKIGAVALWVAWAGIAWAQGASAPQTVAEARDDVQVLRERVAAFWAARAARDFRAQWEFLEPRVKGRVTADEYLAGRGGVQYLGYQVEGATVTGAFATVKVRVLAQPAAAALFAGRRVIPQTVLLGEPWIRVGGVWYRRLESDESGPPRGPTP